METVGATKRPKVQEQELATEIGEIERLASGIDPAPSTDEAGGPHPAALHGRSLPATELAPTAEHLAATTRLLT